MIAGCIILAFSGVITTAMTGDADLEPAVRLLAVVVVAGVILTINQTVLRAQERAGAFAIINGGALITYAVLAVILLTNWRSDANAVMVAWATSLVVFTAIGLLLVRAEAFGRPKIDRGRELLRLSLPLAPAVAIALVGEFVNRAILLSAAGAPNVAYFTVAGRIAAVAGLAVAGFQLAWLPRAYGLGTSEEARGRLAADSLWIVGIVCTLVLGIAVTAPGVLPLITGPGYADALPVLGFSLLTVIGVGLYLVASLPSAMAKATHDLGLAIGAGVLVGVALNLVLVQFWQSVGTAAAVAVGQFLSVVVVTRLGFWRVPLPVNLAKIGGMTIITGLVVLADLVGGLELPARILLGAIALGLIAWSVPWRAAVRQVRDRQPGRTGKEPGR